MMNPPTTPPIAPAAMADAISVLRAVENAAETRSLIESLQSATTEHAAALKLLATKESDLQRREAAADALEAAHKVREKELSDRANSVFIRENKVADLNRENLAKLEARVAALDEREKLLAKREADFAAIRQRISGALGD